MKTLQSILFHRPSAIVIILSIAIVIIGWHNTIGTGSYNYITGEIRCGSRSSCLHEVAHKYDASRGFISMTKEYQHNVDVYRIMLYEYPFMRDKHSFDVFQYPGLGSLRWQNSNPLTLSFWVGGWGGYNEFYADVLMWSDGNKNNCPKSFASLYNWEYVKNEMIKLGYGDNK